MKHSPLLLFVLAAACTTACSDNSGGGGGGNASYQYAIPLTTPDDTLWTAAVTAGSGTFQLDLDTGSTTIGIAGASCSGCNVSPEYTPSSSAVDQGSSSSTQYADGSMWSGEIYKDTISLEHGTPDATLNLVDISAQNGFFYGDNSYQGILGMGPPENAEPDTGAYFHTITAGSAVDPIMSFELCDNGGTMWFGGYDPSHADGAVQYTPMLPIVVSQAVYNAYYSIDVTQMSIDGTVVGQGSSTFEEPILDTGTTLYYLPTSVYNNIVTALNASSGLQTLFPGTTLTPDQYGQACTNTSSVTDAQVNAMLPPLVMNLPNADGGSDISFSVPALQSYMMDAGGGQFCLGIQDGGNYPTFGDQFLQGFVTVIDLDKGRVGLALDKGCSAGSGASARHTHEASLDHPRLPRPRVRR